MADFVATSVADRGPGIDSFEQEMIFDNFTAGRTSDIGARNRNGAANRQGHCIGARGTIAGRVSWGRVRVSFTLPVARKEEQR